MLTKPLPGVMLNPSHPLSKGLVGYWLFNEGSGDIAYDISGNKNHGTLKNMLPNTQGSKWQGSKFGGALSFDGANDYVNCGNGASLNITDTITIEAWVKPNLGGSGTKYFVGKNANIAFGLDDNQDKLISYLYIGGSWSSKVGSLGGIKEGVWQQVVLTYNSVSGGVKFYINGELDANPSQTGALGSSSSNLIIGSLIGGENFFDGVIDSVRVYIQELSIQGIKQLYYDPFSNLMRIPAWQLYVPSIGGLSIPVAMHHYEALRG